MVPLLAGSHRVIRIDLLGCGQSARPDGASYAVHDQARRAGAALGQLGVECSGPGGLPRAPPWGRGCAAGQPKTSSRVSAVTARAVQARICSMEAAR
ncbi:MAG: alpha/beta fold hydrolase, partial [Streptosporangiaceae bacterium]